MMGAQNIGIILALISAACYGTEAIFAKIAYAGGADSLTLLAYRFIFSTVIIWFYFLVTRRNCRVGKRNALRLLGLGAVGLTSVTLAILAALKYISASMTIMLLYTYPTYITFLAYLVLHEALTKRKLMALPLAFGGCGLLLWLPGAAINMTGVFYGLLAAVLNAFYIVITTKVMREVSSQTAIGYLMLSAAIVSTAIAGGQGKLIVHFNGTVWLAIVLMVLISTIASTFTFFLAVEYIGASRTAIIATVEPLVTALLAIIFLHEKLTIIQLLGGLLIMAGVLIERERGKVAEEAN